MIGFSCQGKVKTHMMQNIKENNNNNNNGNT
jgi:hypothetical protein